MVDIRQNPTKPNPIYLIHMFKEDLALNNLQCLICHKTKRNHKPWKQKWENVDPLENHRASNNWSTGYDYEEET